MNVENEITISAITVSHYPRIKFLRLLTIYLSIQTKQADEWIILDTSLKSYQNKIIGYNGIITLKPFVNDLQEILNDRKCKTKIKYFEATGETLGSWRNEINKLASGDLIINFDDDDFYSKHRIQHCFDILTPALIMNRNGIVNDIHYGIDEKIDLNNEEITVYSDLPETFDERIESEKCFYYEEVNGIDVTDKDVGKIIISNEVNGNVTNGNVINGKITNEELKINNITKVKKHIKFVPQIAGCNNIFIYDFQFDKIFQFTQWIGGPWHAPNGTYAYTKSFANTHFYNEIDKREEEKFFTNDFSIPMAGLSPLKTMLVSSCNKFNTSQKKFIINAAKYTEFSNGKISEGIRPNADISIVRDDFTLESFVKVANYNDNILNDEDQEEYDYLIREINRVYKPLMKPMSEFVKSGIHKADVHIYMGLRNDYNSLDFNIIVQFCRNLGMKCVIYFNTSNLFVPPNLKEMWNENLDNGSVIELCDCNEFPFWLRLKHLIIINFVGLVPLYDFLKEETLEADSISMYYFSMNPLQDVNWTLKSSTLQEINKVFSSAYQFNTYCDILADSKEHRKIIMHRCSVIQPGMTDVSNFLSIEEKLSKIISNRGTDKAKLTGKITFYYVEQNGILGEVTFAAVIRAINVFRHISTLQQNVILIIDYFYLQKISSKILLSLLKQIEEFEESTQNNNYKFIRFVNGDLKKIIEIITKRINESKKVNESNEKKTIGIEIEEIKKENEILIAIQPCEETIKNSIFMFCYNSVVDSSLYQTILRGIQYKCIPIVNSSSSIGSENRHFGTHRASSKMPLGVEYRCFVNIPGFTMRHYPNTDRYDYILATDLLHIVGTVINEFNKNNNVFESFNNVKIPSMKDMADTWKLLMESTMGESKRVTKISYSYKSKVIGKKIQNNKEIENKNSEIENCNSNINENETINKSCEVKTKKKKSKTKKKSKNINNNLVM